MQLCCNHDFSFTYIVQTGTKHLNGGKLMYVRKEAEAKRMKCFMLLDESSDVYKLFKVLTHSHAQKKAVKQKNSHKLGLDVNSNYLNTGLFLKQRLSVFSIVIFPRKKNINSF